MRLGNLFTFAALGAALLLAPLAPLHGEAASMQSEKLRIGVVPFQNSSTLRDAAMSGRLAEFLTAELMQNRNYELIERNRIDTIAREQAFGMQGNVDPSTAAQVGKILGLDYIVYGSLLEANANTETSTSSNRTTYTTRAKAVVSVTVVEVETGRIIISERGEATRSYYHGETRPSSSADHYSDSIKEAIGKAGFAIRRDIAPLEPAVIRVSGKEVTLDMGREAGLSEGQKFEIVREGEALTDLQGNIIDVETIKIADITIKSVTANTAIATVVRINKVPGTRRDYVIERGDLARSQEASTARTAGERFNRWIRQ